MYYHSLSIHYQQWLAMHYRYVLDGCTMVQWLCLLTLAVLIITIAHPCSEAWSMYDLVVSATIRLVMY